jgi:hypothetical protein
MIQKQITSMTQQQISYGTTFLLAVVYKCVFKRDKFSVGVRATLKETYNSYFSFYFETSSQM